MSVMEKARELGEQILETPEAKRLNDAREKYNNDELAKAKMDDFSIFKNQIQQGRNQQTLSATEFQTAQTKLNEMAAELKDIPVIGELIEAENNFNGMVNQVFSVLRYAITGETPGCSPSDCASCGGGCS